MPEDSKGLLKTKQLQLITSPRLISWLGHRDLGESQHQGIRSTAIGVMSEVTIQLCFIFTLAKCCLLNSIHEKVVHVIMCVCVCHSLGGTTFLLKWIFLPFLLDPISLGILAQLQIPRLRRSRLPHLSGSVTIPVFGWNAPREGKEERCLDEWRVCRMISGYFWWFRIMFWKWKFDSFQNLLGWFVTSVLGNAMTWKLQSWVGGRYWYIPYLLWDSTPIRNVYIPSSITRLYPININSKGASRSEHILNLHLLAASTPFFGSWHLLAFHAIFWPELIPCKLHQLHVQTIHLSWAKAAHEKNVARIFHLRPFTAITLLLQYMCV